MTIALTLMIGALSKQPSAAALRQLVGARARQLFLHASDDDIRLSIEDHGSLGGGGAVTSDALHSRLEDMTGYQRNQDEVANIGLLIADSYAPAREAFGIMFDDAFWPDGSNAGQRTPREGCAVFLDGIAGARAPSDRLEEGLFTAIHELGHVFNLQHSDSRSFMYRSALEPRPVKDGAFNAKECNWLSRCSRESSIRPGGSPFGDLGVLQSAKLEDITNTPDCALTISASKEAFWHFEPVELDVELRGSGGRKLVVPDALDTGYDVFSLWIEEPDGTRRKRRSPVHYCSPRGTLTLDAQNAFRRDISIFGESGGYTFRRAGRHRIWAVFEYRPGIGVRSNVIEVEVLAEDERSAFWRDGAAVLASVHGAQSLYYRRMTKQRRAALQRLTEFAEAHRRDATSAMTRYAVGRALGRAALDRKGVAAATLAREARHQLRLAARRTTLGEHRRELAERMLENLSGT